MASGDTPRQFDRCVTFYCDLPSICFFFFFNDTATTEIYTLSLHDALPICTEPLLRIGSKPHHSSTARDPLARLLAVRSEEHTSELQSRLHLVCRLLLEKKKKHARLILHPLSSTP